MAELNRSLAACKRCRKSKVKCDGPDKIPCGRCELAGAECIFVAPRKSLGFGTINQSIESSDQSKSVDQLATSLNELRETSSRAIIELQDAVADLNRRLPPQRPLLGGEPARRTFTSSPRPPRLLEEASRDSGFSEENQGPIQIKSGNLVQKGIITMEECTELFDLYIQHCNGVVAVIAPIDEPMTTILETPLLIATVCTVGARTSKSKLHDVCRKETELLIQQTFTGSLCDLPSLKAIMLYAMWHRSDRILGHVMSLSYESGLHKAASALIDPKLAGQPRIVEMARTWLSFCCIDMLIHLHSPYLVSNIQHYMALGGLLCSSPCFRTVDYRIMAYLEVFSITSTVKESLTKEVMSVMPLSGHTTDLISSLNSQLDNWFHKDRNRLFIPYAFVRMFVNGPVLHGIEANSISGDPAYAQLLERAVEAGKILLRTALQSESYRKSLRYTIDYTGWALFLGIHFLFKAIIVARRYIDVASIAEIFQHLVELFRHADAEEHALTVEQMLFRMAQPQQRTPNSNMGSHDEYEGEHDMYDAMGNATYFGGDPEWQQHFPVFDWLPER